MQPDEVLTILRHVGDSQAEAQSESDNGVEGFSGALIRSLLSTLAERIVDATTAYVELGVYRGLTLSSVARSTKGLCVGIDDFSLFNPSGDNRRQVEDLLDAHGLGHVVLLDMDAEDAIMGFGELFPGRSIGLLFVDAGHDYRSQLVSLLFARRHLADGALIVIDDANYRHVRQATEDFLRACPEFALVGQVGTAAHPANLDGPQHEAVRQGWWNGVQVLMHDPAEQILRAELPKSDQHRFRLSHDVFRHLLADRAHDALKAVVTFCDEPTEHNRSTLVQLVGEERSRGRFEHQNTDSSEGTWVADLRM